MFAITQARWFQLVVVVAGVLLLVSAGELHRRSDNQEPLVMPPNIIRTNNLGQQVPTYSSGDYAITCSFDDGYICGWSQATDDDFDWTPHNGSTPTQGTGPDCGYMCTPYIYAEMDKIKKKSEAKIYTKYFPAGEYMLSFRWHMFGKTKMGSLTLCLVEKGGKETVIFQKSGNQGNTWHFSRVRIVTSEKTKLVFTAKKRRTKKGDIALDSIQMRSLETDELYSPPV